MPWIWGRVCWRTPTTAWLWCRSSSAILLKARDLLCGQGRGQIGIWSISETYVVLKWFELSPLPRENFDTLTLRVLEGSPWNLALRTSFDQPLRLRPGRAIEHHRTLSQWQRHTVTTCFPTRCFFPGGNRGVNEQCYIIEQRYTEVFNLLVSLLWLYGADKVSLVRLSLIVLHVFRGDVVSNAAPEGPDAYQMLHALSWLNGFNEKAQLTQASTNTWHF